MPEYKIKTRCPGIPGGIVVYLSRVTLAGELGLLFAFVPFAFYLLVRPTIPITTEKIAQSARMVWISIDGTSNH